MRAFLEPLDRLNEIEKLNICLRKETGLQMISGCIDSQKPHLIYGIGREFPYKIIVTFNEQRAREIYEEYLFFDRQAVYYPAKDILFYQSDLRGNVLTRERILALKRIAEGGRVTLITTYDALMNKMPDPNQFIQAVKTFHVGDVVDVSSFRQRLVEMGYESAF